MSLNVGGDFWGLMRDKQDRCSRFDCSSNEKLQCFDGYRERSFLILCIHNVKRE